VVTTPTPPAATEWTATAVVSALREHFTPSAGPTVGEWTLLTEVPALDNPTGADGGYPHPRDGESAAEYRARAKQHPAAQKVRSIDVLLLRNWASGRTGRERIAVEVKVSRGDFFRDTATKRAPWEALTHRFAYAVPAGLIGPDEVPAGCWLLEVTAQPCTCRRHAASPRRVHWHPQTAGARRRPQPFGEHLVGYLARRASDAERRLAKPDQLDADQIASSLAEGRRMQQKAQSLRSQRDALKGRLDSLTRLVVAVTPQVCADCGDQIVPRATRYSGYHWEHRRKAANEPCQALREARVAEVEAAGGDAWPIRYGRLEPELERVNREQYRDEASATDGKFRRRT
jgi:hypothetical protein